MVEKKWNLGKEIDSNNISRLKTQNSSSFIQIFDAWTNLEKSAPCSINSIELSFAEKAPYRLFRVIWILGNIYPELLRPFFESVPNDDASWDESHFIQCKPEKA